MKKAFQWMSAAAVAFAVTACGPATRHEQIEALKGDVTRGQTAFNKTCATCHGTDGNGTASGPSLKEPAKNDPTHEIIETVINGKGTLMPSQAALPDQEIADIVAYVKATFGT